MLPILKLYLDLETRMKARSALKFSYMKMANKLEADRRPTAEASFVYAIFPCSNSSAFTLER